MMKFRTGLKNNRIWWPTYFFLMFLTGLFSISCAFASGRQRLHGHLPKGLEKAKIIRDVPETDRLDLAIGLPMRNQPALDKYMRDLRDPKSPQYRHTLPDKKFDEMFRPTLKDYKALINFAKANGLTVTQTLATRLLIGVNGTVRDIQKAFHVHLHYYQWPNGPEFISPDSEPSLDIDVQVLQIDGIVYSGPPQPAGK